MLLNVLFLDVETPHKVSKHAWELWKSQNVIALDTKWMTNDATAFLKNNFTNWSQGAF